MTDRAQLGTEPFFGLLLVVFALVIVAALGFTIVDEATSPEARAFFETAEAWCADHGGELTNAQVIGDHGGLHCDLGEQSVHMGEVADAGWPADASAVPEPGGGTSLETVAPLLLAALALILIWATSPAVHRYRTNGHSDGVEGADDE